MVAATNQRKEPFNLVVTGEAEAWERALDKIIGRQWLTLCHVRDDRELLEVVETRQADAAVLDEAADWRTGVLQLLRMIRRVDAMFPVVVITSRRDRRWLEDAMRLAAFSVVVRPLALEELLRQIQRMMIRMEEALRREME